MVDFKAPYSRASAVEFLDKFLPDDFQRYDEEIKLDFKPQFIRHIRKIGEVASLENIHIYEIIHESENDPRVSLSKDSFRLLANFNVRKALIFFVSQNSPNYRLSLVTVDLKWESGARVKREYSNPRRYSFFLGPDARVHTPHDFLIKKGQAKDTTDLLSRFDVEIVTKEFFTKYKGLFEDVSGHLEKDYGFKIFAGKNNIDINTFAKKLLGQIVFCYFLQRKGWLGAKRGELINKGDKDFMRSLFNHCESEKENFYNDYLEYLFYDSLNNRADGSSDFYRKHFDCQIPFLNGGLFEPPEDYDWEKSFVHIPDKIFSNKQNTGILDIFDLYNFTVYEDDPIDREVSVDPEMLGKVFENLLPENLRKGQGAYYTPREIVHYMCQESLINYLTSETKVNTAKIRDLVVTKHFEGEGGKELIDKALQNIKVCDPACGSGAFLVGMLHEIVSARRILNPKEDEYHLKKETIQNCIYGVDIGPGAVEIAKLRLWLSLVVDYELKEIEPLPNLDYKIMCGNSLLEELIIGEESIELFDERLLNISKGNKAKSSLFNNEEFKGKSASARNEYLQNHLKAKQKQMLQLHSENQLTPEKKKELDQEIDALNKELNPKSRKQVIDYHPTLFGDKAEKYFNALKELHKQYFTEYDPKRKRDKRKQIESIEVEFIKSSIKEKVDDIEGRIKNLNMQDPGDRKQQAVLMKKKLEYLAIPEQIYNSQAKPYFLWKLNFFEVFQEKGGFGVVIANPPYLKERDNKNVFAVVNNSSFGKLYHQGKMDYWFYFLHKAIDISKRDSVISYITSRYWLNSSGAKKLIQRIQNELSFVNLIDIGKLKVFDEVSGQHMVAIYQKNNLISSFIYKKLENDLSDIDKNTDTQNIKIAQLSNKEIYQNNEIILHKDNLKLEGVIKLGEIVDISQGVVEASDKLSKKALGKSKRTDLTIGDGIFVLNKREIEKIGLNKNENRFIKRYLDPSDVSRYRINWNEKYLIYADKQSKNEIKNNYDFRNIKAHLDRFKGFITSSNKPYGLHRPREIKYFINPKIIFKNMFVNNQFTFDKEGYFVGFSFSTIIQNDKSYDLKYILAILNSQFALNWFYKNGKKRGAGIDIGVDKLRSFPIKKTSNDEQESFIEIVDKIMLVTKDDDYPENEKAQAKVKEYERQIDQMVYELYGLTKEEIKVVEDFYKK